jgi:hypothetical protein
LAGGKVAARGTENKKDKTKNEGTNPLGALESPKLMKNKAERLCQKERFGTPQRHGGTEKEETAK